MRTKSSAARSGAAPATGTLKKKQLCSDKINTTPLRTQVVTSRRVPATHSNQCTEPQPTLAPLQPLPRLAIKLRMASVQPPSSPSIPLADQTVNQPPPELDYYDGEVGKEKESPIQPAKPGRRTLKKKQLPSKKIISASLRIQGGSSRQAPDTLGKPTCVPPQPLPRAAVKVRKASMHPPSLPSILLAAQSFNQPPPVLDYDVEEGEDNTPLQPALPAKRGLKGERRCSKKAYSAIVRTQCGSPRQVAATVINLSNQPQPTLVPPQPLLPHDTLRKASTLPPATSIPHAAQHIDQPPPELNCDGEEVEDNETPPQPAQPAKRILKRKRLCSKKSNAASLRTQGGSSRRPPGTLSNLGSQPQPTLVPSQPMCLPAIKVPKASTHPWSSPSIALAAQSINQPLPELDHDGEEDEDIEFDHEGEEGEDNEFDHDGEEGEVNELDHDGEDHELDHNGEDNELDHDGEEGEDIELDHEGEEGEDNELDYVGEEGEDNETPLQLTQSGRRKGSWFVAVLDGHGTRKARQLAVRDVWSLPPGEKVVVNWNSQGQPIEDGGGLLNRFLGSIARDFVWFPINYSNWKKVPYDYKDNAYKDTIQAKFDINSDLHKSYVLKSIGSKWKENRLDLWQRRNDGRRNRDQLIAMAPEGMNRDHWTWFVDYRLNPKTMQNAEKNKNNRKKQKVNHTGGSKSLARKRAEMEKIQTYESSMVSLPQDIPTKDSLAHALGSQEHCGHVQGLELGPCPSQELGPSGGADGEMISASSYKELQDEVIALRSLVNEQNKKFDALMTLFTLSYKGQLPSDLDVFRNS